MVELFAKQPVHMAVYVYIATSKLYKEENVRRGVGKAKKLKMYFCADAVKSDVARRSRREIKV
jgi:hypothetical protein